MSSIKDYYNTGQDSGVHAYGDQLAYFAQTYTAATNYTAISVKLYFSCYLSGENTIGTISVELQGVSSNVPDGNTLASGSTDGDTLVDETPEWREITFDAPYDISSGTKYAIMVNTPEGSSNAILVWLCDTTGNYYGGSYVRKNIGNGYVWEVVSGTDLMFEMWGEPDLPEKPTTPAPSNEEANIDKTTGELTWVDGGSGASAADTFNIHFGTTSGDLTELQTEINVGSPTWTSPMVALEINDYNPASASGYRSPIAGDEITDGTTTYTLWDIKRGDLVNVQYEAKLYAFRVGPPCIAGTVLTNGVSPDVDDPQAVSVTLNNSYWFNGEVESAHYPYATRYYWRVDSVNEAGTTTGDEWYFDTQYSEYLYERPPSYNEDYNWGYTDGSYQWADFHTAGGGRYKQQLIAIGHNCIYYEEV